MIKCSRCGKSGDQKMFLEYRTAYGKTLFYKKCRPCLLIHREELRMKKRVLNLAIGYSRLARRILFRRHRVIWAGLALRKAIREGIMRKENVCSSCGTSESQCHHPDYTKPYSFIELCLRCHRKTHGMIGNGQLAKIPL